MPEVRLMVTVGLGVLFLIAALTKVRQFSRFRSAVAGYELLPRRLVGPVSRLVPVIELGWAAALLSGLVMRTALVAAAVLLLCFCIAMALVLAAGRQPDCACGVGRDRPVGPALITRNLALALFALLGSMGTAPSIRDLVSRPSALPHGAGVAALLILTAGALAARVLSEGRRATRALRRLTGSAS